MGAEWPTGLDPLLPEYLAAQRWYSGMEVPDRDWVSIDRASDLWTDDEGVRRLWQVIVSVGSSRYHLLLGERPAGERADFLHGHEEAVVGALESSYFYDATLDAEMAKILLSVASGGAEKAAFARPLAAEQSNTSLVYDDRLILKVFRRLHIGRNADVEVTTALATAGFAHVATPLVEWREDDYDLAFGQEFLVGASEGWAMALTSLRNFFSGEAALPEDAGGDFAAEAERLGRVTAEMHTVLRAVFGRAPGRDAHEEWSALVEGLPGRLAAASEIVGKDLGATAGPLLARLREVSDPGPAIRTHGDFHLGQVMRTDSGWYVLDFEGEPARLPHERGMAASPLKDVTGMLRSFHYATRQAVREWPEADRAGLEGRAAAWEGRNRQAYLDGYRAWPDIDALLPASGPAADVMAAYELDKALYELDYELAHRPEWVGIPLEALDRFTHGADESD
jgi:maltokinase